MFGVTTSTPIPDEFITSHAAWEGYIAHIWQQLLGHYGVERKDTLIEIAPGCSSKVGLALQKIAFEGTLYLVDPLGSALEAVTEKYAKYLPKAVIYPIQTTLHKALPLLPTKPDFLLANHPLDDMLLAAITESVTPELFVCTSKAYTQSRLALEKEPTKFISFVISCWQRAVEELLPGMTIVCQYPSLILKQHNLHSLNIYAALIMEGLKKHCPSTLERPEVLQRLLNAHENFGDEHIGTEVLNAKNWMVLKR